MVLKKAIAGAGSTSDRLCLDGQRLMLATGSNSGQSILGKTMLSSEQK